MRKVELRMNEQEKYEFIKAVLREQKIPFEIKSNTFDEIIYEKLKEAELEMDNSSKRYNINDVESSMNSIINKD